MRRSIRKNPDAGWKRTRKNVNRWHQRATGEEATHGGNADFIILCYLVIL